MQCVRCSHQLPPRADRCLRCFALNPQNAPGPLSMPLHDSGPARPGKVRISEPTAKPVAISFSKVIDAGDIDLRDTATKPEREPEPAPEPKRAREPEPAPE